MADPNLNTLPHNSSSADELCAAYNAVAVPDFWVWRTLVSKQEYTTGRSVDGTTFSYVGAGFITRSQGERDAWGDLFDNRESAVNPSLTNVQQAFQDIFSGAQAPAPANRTHMQAVSRRTATRLEKLFATGTGSSASPATMAVEGPLTLSEADTLWSD